MDSTSVYKVSYDGNPEYKGFESVDRDQIDIEQLINKQIDVEAADLAGYGGDNEGRKEFKGLSELRDASDRDALAKIADQLIRRRNLKTIQSRVAEEYKILFARQTVFNLNKRGVGMIGYFAESLKNTVWPDQFYWYG